MAGWVQIVLSAAALVVAVATIWQKAIRPAAKAVSQFDQIVPVLNALSRQFADSPDLIVTISNIAKQFKPNNGSSLRDRIDALERGLGETRVELRVILERLEAIHVEVRRDR